MYGKSARAASKAGFRACAALLRPDSASYHAANVTYSEPKRAAVFDLKRAIPLSLLLSIASPGCASAGQYVWYSELPKTEQGVDTGDYVIGVGDSVNIRVYEQDGLSGEIKIRNDGKIGLPLAGEVVAAGKRPFDLSREIEQRMKEFIVSPRVVVNVTVAHPVSVTVVGEVGAVGTLTMDPPARLVDALAKSGGLNDFADTSKIFVLRQFPAFRRVRFKWEDIMRNAGGAATFPLRTGDVVVVE